MGQYALPLAIVGAAGIGAAGSSGAFSGGGGSPDITNVPLNPKTRALQDIFAKTLALNFNTRAPGLLEDIKSGGTSTFPLTSPGITAEQAVQLGFVGRTGEIPMFDPSKGSVLPKETALRLGQEQLRKSEGFDRVDLFRRIAKTQKRITKQQRLVDTKGEDVNRKLLAKHQARLDRLFARTGVQI